MSDVPESQNDNLGTLVIAIILGIIVIAGVFLLVSSQNPDNSPSNSDSFIERDPEDIQNETEPQPEEDEEFEIPSYPTELEVEE